MSHRISRRKFLQGAAVAAGLTVLTGGTRVNAYAVNGKLNIAFIGTGGRAESHLGMANNENCPCFCDVDINRQGKAAGMFKGAKAYQDYRKMYDEMAKSFDCVVVATPDNHHAPAVMRALRLGKGAMVEKPAVETVFEARTISDEIQKRKLPSQMGNQGHDGQGIRRQVEWVNAGLIGTVKETHTWTGRPVWPQGMGRPNKTDPVPANLDWDCWIGPAPMRPYVNGTYHDFKWRGWYDFGTGAVGDMGCHTFDSVYWSMGSPTPVSVECLNAESLNKETFPLKAIYRWEFAAGTKHPAFTGYWYENGQKPPVPPELAALGKKGFGGSGSLLVGTKGFIVNEDDYSNSPRPYPESLVAEAKNIPQLERSPGFEREFIMACKGEKPWDFPKSNFIYAGAICETLLLGNLSTRVGLKQKLLWDSKNLKFTNNAAANEFVTRTYRKGWEL
jgi:predicted dehydrogenase